MNVLEMLSDNDVVVVMLSTQDIVKKEIQNFDPASLLIEKSKKILLLCEDYKSNPTCYSVSSDDKKWNNILVDELKRSPNYRVNVTDLDNNTNIVEVFSSIRLTVYNYKSLKKEILKEIICATAFTPFGSLTLETQVNQSIV
jgi:hypothetical protein